MSVAKTIEISSDSNTGFDDAIKSGIAARVVAVIDVWMPVQP